MAHVGVTGCTNRRLLNLTKIMCCTSATITWVLKSTSMASDDRDPWMTPLPCLSAKNAAIAAWPFELISRYWAVTKASVVSNVQSPVASPIGYGPTPGTQSL